jgi:hypothetical protein
MALAGEERPSDGATVAATSVVRGKLSIRPHGYHELSDGGLRALRPDRGERFRLVGGDASQRATALRGNRPVSRVFLAVGPKSFT